MELGLENNAPIFTAFVNDILVESAMESTEDIIAPTEDAMNILTARGGYFSGKFRLKYSKKKRQLQNGIFREKFRVNA